MSIHIVLTDKIQLILSIYLYSDMPRICSQIADFYCLEQKSLKTFKDLHKKHSSDDFSESVL